MNGRVKRFLRYVINVLLSLILRWYWSIPAWILLVLHFTAGISIWWFVGALALYVIAVRVYVHVISWLVRMGNSDEPEKKNVNPYSSGSKEERKENDIR